MLNPLSYFFLMILIILISIQLFLALLSKDKAIIWSPLTFISCTLVYYVVIPSLSSMRGYDISHIQFQWIFYLTALIFYLFVLLGFYLCKRVRFSNWDTYITNDNAFFYGIVLFFIAIICYVPFRGFRTTVWDADASLVSERAGLISYFIDLISILCASCGLILMSNIERSRPIKWVLFAVLLYLTIVVYIVGGFRVRIVFLAVTLLTIVHLYLRPKRVKVLLITGVALPLFLLFAAMDTSRVYGFGLNRESLEEITIDQVEVGARENAAVLYFSILCTDYYYRNGEKVGIEPFYNAILMPFPRALFPWKPSGEYMRAAQLKTLGTAEGGAAYLNFTEGFVSLGLIGVILYELMMGLLSGVFWNNYYWNRSSIGAILLLSLYNGFCYQWISRGYLGGNLNSFLYYVIVPFWLIALIRLFKYRKKTV